MWLVIFLVGVGKLCTEYLPYLVGLRKNCHMLSRREPYILPTSTRVRQDDSERHTSFPIPIDVRVILPSPQRAPRMTHTGSGYGCRERFPCGSWPGWEKFYAMSLYY